MLSALAVREEELALELLFEVVLEREEPQVEVSVIEGEVLVFVEPYSPTRGVEMPRVPSLPRSERVLPPAHAPVGGLHEFGAIHLAQWRVRQPFEFGRALLSPRRVHPCAPPRYSSFLSSCFECISIELCPFVTVMTTRHRRKACRPFCCIRIWRLVVEEDRVGRPKIEG